MGILLACPSGGRDGWFQIRKAFMTSWLDSIWVLLRMCGEAIWQSAAWLAEKLIDWALLFFESLRVYGDSVLTWICGELSTYIPSPAFGSVAERLDQINYFFPLGEAISYGALLLGLWSVVFVYRVIKSWIPTVSS